MLGAPARRLEGLGNMRAVVDLIGVDDDGALCAMAEQVLEAVISNNRYLMQRYPGKFPLLRESGVRFRAEPWAVGAVQPSFGFPNGRPPIEQFTPYPVLLARGWGDCAQLCCVRVAELREAGEHDARLRFYCRTNGEGPNRKRWYHVEVRRGRAGGKAIEDPSRELDF